MAYCSVCEHPHGYHSATRGCTMPLNSSGYPLGAHDEYVRMCRCGVPESGELPTFQDAVRWRLSLAPTQAVTVTTDNRGCITLVIDNFRSQYSFGSVISLWEWLISPVAP